MLPFHASVIADTMAGVNSSVRKTAMTLGSVGSAVNTGSIRSRRAEKVVVLTRRAVRSDSCVQALLRGPLRRAEGIEDGRWVVNGRVVRVPEGGGGVEGAVLSGCSVRGMVSGVGVSEGAGVRGEGVAGVRGEGVAGAVSPGLLEVGLESC